MIKCQSMNGNAHFFGSSMVQNRCHLQKSPGDDANISLAWAHFPVAAVDVFFQRRSAAAGARASHGEIKISECSLRKRVNPPQRSSVQEAVRVQSRWLRYWTALMFFLVFHSPPSWCCKTISVWQMSKYFGERLVLWWQWKGKMFLLLMKGFIINVCWPNVWIVGVVKNLRLRM